GRGRDPPEPRPDGRHRPEEGRRGLDPGRFRRQHRCQRGARLRRCRNGAHRDRVLLPDARPARALIGEDARNGVMNASKGNETTKVRLLGLDREALERQCADWGQKPFRARQLLRWIHQRGVDDFDAMTDLAQEFRGVLARHACVEAPPVLADHESADGTRKWLLDVGGGNAVETVFIPETDRGTLCVSTQAGCAVNCLFCSTGKQGFARNLRPDEIVAQVWHAKRSLERAQAGRGSEARVVTNVVFMGMGEPLQNYAATLAALRLLLDDHAYGLSRRRVTVSTSGVVPMIDRLRDDCPVALAVSL